MALQPQGPAPYTTAAAAITVLDAWRDRGFGTPAGPDTLIRTGVPETLARRTLQSLMALELFDGEGRPTPQFEDFRATRGDDEYRSRLQEWLRGQYADVLQYTNPSEDHPDRVAEAFRTYDPPGQRRSMASLLIGLWKYSGLPTPEGQSAPPRATRRPAPRPASRPPASASRGRQGSSSRNDEGSSDLPPALVGLLRQIPSAGWTKEERTNFLRAFEAVLDFAVPVREPEAFAQANDDAEEVSED